MAPKTLKQTQTAKAWAECWAEPVSTASASTRAEFLKQYGVMEQRTVSACPTLNLGTDCAGAEAPVWALKALGVPFRHQWAAEIAPHAKKFISVTCGLPQCRLLGDMCARDHSVLEPIDLYVCGFPCKPWSRLNNRSLYWDDPNARPFKAGYHFQIQCLCQCQSCYTSHHVFLARPCWTRSVSSGPLSLSSKMSWASCASWATFSVRCRRSSRSTTFTGPLFAQQCLDMRCAGPGSISRQSART